MDASRSASLKQLAALFLRLGVTAFGGPAVHISLMRDEAVRRRAWRSDAEFLDLRGAASLLPGPSSTEMAIYLGRRQAGWPGIAVAGSCFLLPAALLVGAIAWAYVRFGSLPQVAGLLYGVKPVVIAVLAQALWNLRRAALKTRLVTAVGLAALATGFLGGNVAGILLGAGGFVALVQWFSTRWRSLRPPAALLARSEERRVGKECRSRW